MVDDRLRGAEILPTRVFRHRDGGSDAGSPSRPEAALGIFESQALMGGQAHLLQGQKVDIGRRLFQLYVVAGGDHLEPADRLFAEGIGA